VKRGEEIMGIADPRLDLDVEYYCGCLSRQRGGEMIGLFCVETFDEVVNHYLPETWRSSCLISRQKEQWFGKGTGSLLALI
jgi:hypothetical protein